MGEKMKRGIPGISSRSISCRNLQLGLIDSEKAKCHLFHCTPTCSPLELLLILHLHPEQLQCSWQSYGGCTLQKPLLRKGLLPSLGVTL